MDLISVIMPTYNAAKWVTGTIDSLAAQTYPHFELIVADDGSRDDTVSVVRNKLAKSFSTPGRSERRQTRAQAQPETVGSERQRVLGFSSSTVTIS
jgi:glycosyltransferase involved in cell wall biosynthesis